MATWQDYLREARRFWELAQAVDGPDYRNQAASILAMRNRSQRRPVLVPHWRAGGGGLPLGGDGSAEAGLQGDAPRGRGFTTSPATGGGSRTEVSVTVLRQAAHARRRRTGDETGRTLHPLGVGGASPNWGAAVLCGRMTTGGNCPVYSSRHPPVIPTHGWVATSQVCSL